jgi:2-hydroxy-6-oxonona-2,4-dienedioate hydrolase
MAAFKRISTIGLVAAVAAGAAWIGYAYRSDINQARARVAAGSQVISTPCGPIEYAEVGNGPPILGIHGAGGGFDQGLAVIGPLATEGYRVIVMSRFGYLRTPAPPLPSIALQAAAHACLLDALRIEKAAVIGVSAGAPSALEFALRHPERCTALILLVPGWYPTGTASAQRLSPVEARVFASVLRSDFLYWAISRFLPRLADRTVLGTPPAVIETATPQEQARIASLLRDISPISERRVGLSLEGQLTVERLSRPLESMNVRTLAVSAADDLYGTYANARFIAQSIPHCRFIGFHAGGHMLVGHTGEFRAAAVAFLQEPGEH